MFDDTPTMRSAPKGKLWTGEGKHKCVQSGCTNETSGSAIRTDGGHVHACSKHKEVAGGKKRKNVLAEAEKAQARKLAAEARRQEREANKK